MGLFDRLKRRQSPPGVETPDRGMGKRGAGDGDVEHRGVGESGKLPSIEEPLYAGYVRRYKAITIDLRERYIPPSGPSAVLQAELRRAVDKLWFEGQDNGNINWDADFEYFCDLLEKHLLSPAVLDEPDRQMATQSLAILRDCGRQAYVSKPDWARGLDDAAIEARYPGLLATPVDPDEVRLAYVYDDLYQHLMDCVAIYAQAHPAPIPYTAPPEFRR